MYSGFREQTRKWPQRPVDVAIQWLKPKPSQWIVADLGCGDAELSTKASQKVLSFDLIATNPRVIACNMTRVPLPPQSIDVAIFCLSLMGTDYGSFLLEASRLLRENGWLWIAEVQSRFMDECGKSILHIFIAAVENMGFALKKKTTDNSHFVVLEFQGKKGRVTDNVVDDVKIGGQSWPSLRACQYKKR